MTFIRSWRKSFWAILEWNLMPQFLTQVSNTYNEWYLDALPLANWQLLTVRVRLIMWKFFVFPVSLLRMAATASLGLGKSTPALHVCLFLPPPPLPLPPNTHTHTHTHTLSHLPGASTHPLSVSLTISQIWRCRAKLPAEAALSVDFSVNQRCYQHNFMPAKNCRSSYQLHNITYQWAGQRAWKILQTQRTTSLLLDQLNRQKVLWPPKLQSWVEPGYTVTSDIRISLPADLDIDYEYGTPYVFGGR